MPEARRSRIDLAISSPCFEIWLLWHYEDRTAWTDAPALARALRPRGFSGKNLPDDFPYERYPEAVRRAARCGEVRMAHAPPNSHSTMPALVSALLAAHGHAPQG